MMRRKSPQLKKQDEYDKDHRTLMEHPHAFRKNWPKKKAYANRSTRRMLKSLLTKSGENSSAEAKSLLRPKAIHKNSVMKLRDAIEIRKKRRVDHR
jgi:hypothetical protein